MLLLLVWNSTRVVVRFCLFNNDNNIYVDIESDNVYPEIFNVGTTIIKRKINHEKVSPIIIYMYMLKGKFIFVHGSAACRERVSSRTSFNISITIIKREIDHEKISLIIIYI